MIEVTQTGLKELGEALQALADKGYKEIVPKALRRAANPVRNSVRAKAPVLKKPDERRTPGTIKKNVVIVKEGRLPAGILGVRVKVRKLSRKSIAEYKRSSGLAGANNPKDPFYWAAVEKGGGNAPAQPFLRPAFDSTKEDFTRNFTAEVEKEVVKLWNSFK